MSPPTRSSTSTSIAGNISGGGTAAVGAAVAVPVITKETHAFIGDYARVSAKGGGGPHVKTGRFTVDTVDTRFDASTAISGNTIDLGYNHGFTDGDEVALRHGRRHAARRADHEPDADGKASTTSRLSDRSRCSCWPRPAA